MRAARRRRRQLVWERYTAVCERLGADGGRGVGGGYERAFTRAFNDLRWRAFRCPWLIRRGRAR